MWTWNRSVQETGTENNGNSNSYSVNYTPYSTPTFRVSTDIKKYDMASIPSAGTKTATDSFANVYNVTYVPFSPITLTSLLSYENYFNRLGTSLSDTINLEGDFGLKYAVSNELSLSTSFIHKSTVNKRTKDIFPKEVVDAGAAYRVFTWGTLTYGFEQEINKGEIQGGVFTNLNLSKASHSLSLDFNIPQDNVILSSIVLKLLWKQMNYINNYNTADNFIAQLWSFEGTINF